MFNFARTAGLAAVAAVSMTAAAEAATIYATGVVVNVDGARLNGAATPADDRLNPLNSLYAPDDAWYSLGLGGSATYTFLPTTSFRGPGGVIEITKGSRDNHVESMDIFGIDGMGNVSALAIGSIINSGATALTQAYTFAFSGHYAGLMLVDTSSGGSGPRDGFDVESISVTAPIPVPAGGILLLSALGGIAALRRRKA